MTLPLPSSPNWHPKTTVPGIRTRERRPAQIVVPLTTATTLQGGRDGNPIIVSAGFDAGLPSGGRGVRVSRADSERIPTYITGLDERLGGGVPRGHVILVSGPAGSLKSTLVYRILFNEAIERDASALYLSMEQSRKSLLAQMSSFGLDAAKA